MNGKVLTLILVIFSLMLMALITRGGDLAWMALPFLAYLGIGILQSPVLGKISLQARRVVEKKETGGIPSVQVNVNVHNQGIRIITLGLSDPPQPGMRITVGFSITCVTCLAVGYGLVGQWLALSGSLLALPAWLFGYQWRSRSLFLAALLFSVGLAAAGLFAGASPTLMMISAALALAGWDGMLLDLSLADHIPANPVSLFEKNHFQSLAPAFVSGLLAAIAGQMLRFRIPCGGLVLLVILALSGLERVWRTLRG